ARVLYPRFGPDRRPGTYDRDRFLLSLEVPRYASYLNDDWLHRLPGSQIARLGAAATAGAIAGLEPIHDDEALVREHLEHFLAHEGVEAFAAWIRRDWLGKVLGPGRLLARGPDAARWPAMLPEDELAALRDRVDVELSPRNPARFGAGDPVVLDVLVKNVPELVIKVFRINALAYFLARGEEVDTSVDLDGM